MYYIGLFGGMAFAGLVLMYKPDTRYVPSSSPCRTQFALLLTRKLFFIRPTQQPSQLSHDRLDTSPNTTAFRLGPWPRRRSVSNRLATSGSTSHPQTRATPRACRMSHLAINSLAVTGRYKSANDARARARTWLDLGAQGLKLLLALGQILKGDTALEMVLLR